MEQAIRHPDGTMITSGEWTAIKATARMIRADLLALPPPRDKRAKDRPKTKTYYRSFFLKDWDTALEKMEQHQPLLALCAAHWKADHVLGNTLLAKSSASADDESDDEPMDADKPKTQRSSETKKCSASRHDSTSREAKKRKKVQRPNETMSVISAPDTASDELMNSPNETATKPANPVDMSAVSGSAATTETANTSNTDVPAGRTAAVGATDVDTAVGAKAAGTKAGYGCNGSGDGGCSGSGDGECSGHGDGGCSSHGHNGGCTRCNGRNRFVITYKFYYWRIDVPVSYFRIYGASFGASAEKETAGLSIILYILARDTGQQTTVRELRFGFYRYQPF